MDDSNPIFSALLKLPIFRSEWVLYLLIGTSLASVAVMLERWFFYRQRRFRAAPLTGPFSQHLERGDFQAAARLFEGARALESRVLLAGLCRVHKGADAVEELMQGALGHERSVYDRRLDFLATVASNAPYVGLFGTVLGIVRAFRDLAQNSSEASAAVMAGIAEALVATAMGLFVAIPALVAFNVCKARVRTAVGNCQLLMRVLLAELRARDLVSASTAAAASGAE
jgi:biopolymer transport protein ExbB/TolQ